MRITTFGCDMCETTAPGGELPSDWIIVSQLQHDNEDLHFCSVHCFNSWADQWLDTHYTAVPDEKSTLALPATKMRRFFLIDQDADEHEGVLWGNGVVTLTPAAMGTTVPYKEGVTVYPSWEVFQNTHPGEGVTWIDPAVEEVKG